MAQLFLEYTIYPLILLCLILALVKLRAAMGDPDRAYIFTSEVIAILAVLIGSVILVFGDDPETVLVARVFLRSGTIGIIISELVKCRDRIVAALKRSRRVMTWVLSILIAPFWWLR